MTIARPPVQLSLCDFMSAQAVDQWNLLIADALLITIPPLIMFTVVTRQIVAGMTSGPDKG